MRILTMLAATLMAALAAPAMAQDPIAEAIAAIDNYDSDGAKTILDTACKGGNSEACWRYALVMADDYSDEGQARADKQFLANCAKGEARSCYMVAKRVGYGNDEAEQAKKDAKAKTALAKACEGGLGFACLDYADKILFDGGSAGSNRVALLRVLVRACDAGYGDGCQQAAALYQEDYVEETFDLAKALELATKACQLGFGGGCSDMANFERRSQEGEPSKADLVRWQEYTVKACKLGQRDSCLAMLTNQLNLP